MYFHTLPTEILATIIKYVFLKIESQQEEATDTLSKKRKRILSLSMLFSENSPFRDVVSQLSFNEIQLGRVTEAPCLWLNNSLFVIGPELFEDESLELGIPERFLQLSGKSVKGISILVNSNDLPPTEISNNVFFQKFEALVKMYCPNVENLGFTSLTTEDNPLPFEDIVPGLLEKFYSQLVSIRWFVHVNEPDKGYLRFPDIRMCTNLRELDVPNSPQLISFLRSFGVSLESLNVSFEEMNGYEEVLDVIEHNCTKLAIVSLWDCLLMIETVGEERYANFLCSFGYQLTSAEVEGLSVGKLARVLKACPNLLICTDYVRNDGFDNWERVSLLGSMIQYLIVEADICHEEKFEEAISKCSNLASLTIQRNYAYEREDGIDGSSVSFLSSLSLSLITSFCYRDFTATQQNIFMLSTALKNLRELSLDVVNPIENGIDFKAIAESNPRLNSIIILEYNDDDDERGKAPSIAVLRMLVNAFSKCQAIDFTLINTGEECVTRDEIHDICSSLPCRGVYIRVDVGSTLYHQTD